MQSLHRGSFCAQDGEKPGEGSDANHDERSDGNPSRRLARFLALLALSVPRLSQATFGYISEDSSGQRKRALAFTHRRIFG